MTLTIIDYLVIAGIGYILITYALPPAIVKANIKHDEIALKIQLDEVYEKIVNLTTDNSVFKSLSKDEQKAGKNKLKSFSDKCFEVYTDQDKDVKTRYQELITYKNQIENYLTLTKKNDNQSK